MDARTIELSNLRFLNECLNQTIEVLLRGQRGVSPSFGGVGQGWGVAGQLGGQSPVSGVDPMYALQSQWAQQPWGSSFGGGVPGLGFRGFGASGIPHTGQVGWSQWGVSPIDIARQQLAMYGRPFGASPFQSFGV